MGGGGFWMVKALITGGMGVVGKMIAPVFDADIYDIVNGDDIWDTNKLVERVRGKDVVIHLAGIPRYLPGVEGFDRDIDFIKLNFGGTVQVVSCMRRAGVNKIIFSSSGAAYGMESKDFLDDLKYTPLDEEHPATDEKKMRMYGLTKIASEEYLMAQPDIKAYVFRLEGPGVIETGGVLSKNHLYAHTSVANLQELMVRMAKYGGPSDIFNSGDSVVNKFCPPNLTEPLYSVKKAQRLLGYEGRS